jgi:phosphoglycerate dehydrogenase-like enzyme
MPLKVFYMNPGVTPEIEGMVRECLPEGWELLLPGPGGDYAPALAACDFILIADQAVSAEHIAAAPGLRMIQHQGVGYERIDLAACRARGIPLALAPEGTTVAVSEHTLLLILAVYRCLITAVTAGRDGRWLQWELRGGSFELAGKCLGLVGFGRIGREVARRARAFDARVSYYDPVATVPPETGVERAATLQALFRSSDVVSLHLPLTSATRHTIDARTLGWLQPHAVLINTARGGLVNEAALVQALRCGRLAAAGLDVLEQEPPDPANPLLHLENVVVSPHIAAGTRDSFRAKMQAGLGNLTSFATGGPIRNVVPELADFQPAVNDRQ